MLKSLTKSLVYEIDYLLLFFLGKAILRRKGIKKVHFSIDDAYFIFMEERNPVCADVQILYNLYGVRCHLYAFYTYKGRTLSSVSDSIQNEENIDVGPHQAEYIEETYKIFKGLKRSKYVRLHEFKANATQVEKIKQGG